MKQSYRITLDHSIQAYGIIEAETIEEATNNRLPVLLQYQMAYITLAIILFMLIYAKFTNLILAGIGFAVPIGYGASIPIYDFWAVIAIILWLGGCAIMEGRKSI